MKAVPGVMLFDNAVSLEIEVPEGWGRASSTTFPLILAAPDVTSGHRPLLGFSGETFGGSREGLAVVVRAARESHARDYPDFEQLEEDERNVNGRVAYVAWFRWQAAEPPAAFTQVFALMPVGDRQLLEVDEAMLTEAAAQYRPLFEQIIASIVATRST
jgi:hypothetical protein